MGRQVIAAINVNDQRCRARFRRRRGWLDGLWRCVRRCRWIADYFSFFHK